MRIIFMGTPQFAVASLDALIKAGCDIVAVITAPDKPAGRGQKLNQSAVKQYADENGIKVLQPEKLKTLNFYRNWKPLRPICRWWLPSACCPRLFGICRQRAP
jgi:methionyl-tRNA formyltransferase